MVKTVKTVKIVKNGKYDNNILQNYKYKIEFIIININYNKYYR